MISADSTRYTFLFTDIEGSTRLWEREPEQMRPDLEQHDRLLAEVIMRHGGHVFKTVGDSFCSVFDDAERAVHAAVEAQLLLCAEVPRLKVRMAMHTGEAQSRDGDYFGPALNRVARLLSTAHGGQALLTHSTHALVHDRLPDSMSLKSLGEHRLRDLSRPEVVFQLCHPDLSPDFPPLRSLDHPDIRNNLPSQMTSFIGREKEMGEIQTLLGGTRLLCLTGIGGVGKTRLMLQTGAEWDQADVWLVELAPLSDAALIPQAVAAVLGVREQPDRPVIDTLVDALKDRKMLLLLDNCEHLLAAAARCADTILTQCPAVKILASSREGLGVAGEQLYRVPSLGLPPEPTAGSLAEAGPECEAVRLFTERAKLARADFAGDRLNTPVIARICRQLDGIPLALELAAARVRAMTIEQLEARLVDRFRLLTGGSRTALPHQQTLRALIDWSYDLLNEREQTVLRGLAVFAGGWRLEAAERILAEIGIDEWDVLDLLASLADKSLVIYEETRGDGRYRLLETVRQYARDRALECSEWRQVRGRHCSCYLAMLAQANVHLRGPDQGLWLSRLEIEHDNLRSALDFCLQEPDEVAIGLELGAGMSRFWQIRGHLTEGRERLAALLAVPGAEAPTRGRAEALKGAALLAQMQGDYGATRSPGEESLAIYRALGDSSGVAGALASLAIVAREQGDFARAHALLEESLAIQRELGDRSGIAAALNGLGNVATRQGDFTKARGFLEESLILLRELGDKHLIAGALANLGNVAFNMGRLDDSRALSEESLALYRELGSSPRFATVLNSLGNVATAQGQFDAARALFVESLALGRQFGSKQDILGALINLAIADTRDGNFPAASAYSAESTRVCVEIGNRLAAIHSVEVGARLAVRMKEAERAVICHSACGQLRQAIGAPWSPKHQADVDSLIAELEVTLGSEAHAAALAAGHAMSFEQLVAYALRE